MCSIGQRKIGVFLSGGLDSTLIAHELNKLKKPAITFTNKMRPMSLSAESTRHFNSDADAAKHLATVEGYQHTVVKVTADNIIDSWDDSIYYMEQPVYNQSIALYYYTNKVLHDNGIVVTMAGDMGDEILGGYPKYWELTQTEYIERMIGKKQIDTWDDVLALWMQRIKRPLAGLVMGGDLTKKQVLEELKKCYPDDLWNPKDPVASYMALDCVTEVPEEFFMRNDKFGMAFGMEGRFPLATKMFMEYCMSIPVSDKIGINKKNTKLPTRIAYELALPEMILKKEKTGWTVPLGDLLTTSTSTTLTNFYNNALKDKGGLDFIKTSWEGGKALVSSWIISDWIKKYKMKI
tara:strand:+ start:1 stop:1047 length:1047 start_codon:yes stop_codon:yes gene_type:complete